MKILKFILLAFIALFIIYDSKNHLKYYNIEVGELCLIKRTTGFPCPACGMTRAHIEVFRLNFKKAFYYHPLFILPSIILAIIILRNKSKTADYIYNNKYIIFAVLFIFIAVYIVRFVLLFPYKEPFTYNYDNNLYIVLKIFKNIF